MRLVRFDGIDGQLGPEYANGPDSIRPVFWSYCRLCRIAEVNDGLGAHLFYDLLAFGFKFHFEQLFFSEENGVGHTDFGADGFFPSVDSVPAQVTLMRLSLSNVELDDSVGTGLDARAAACALVGENAHDAGLFILDNGAGLASLDARGVFAMLTRHDPAYFREGRIHAFALGLYTQVIGYLSGHTVFVIHDAVAVATGYHAGLAADAAVQIYGEA